MASIGSPVSGSSTSGNGQTYRGPFAIMTILFFMWGFMTVWNDILIPRFKEAFELTQTQANLVQFAFFGAYGIGSLIYVIISMTSGDPINRIGYKNGVVIGLLTAAVGIGAFYPAGEFESYPMFLGALFVVGLGFALLQIAANPYVTILGPERTASGRLNLSQAFNSVGTTLAPIIGGWLIFKYFNKSDAHGAESVQIPYLLSATVFLFLAVIFKLAKLPTFTNTEQIPRGLGALKHPHTALGMVAIFMYVGGEVSVGSLIINFLGTPELGSISHADASNYLAFYWGGLMIGRFMGAFALSDIRKPLKAALIIAVPVIAFLLVAYLPLISASLQKMFLGDAAGMVSTQDAMTVGWSNALHYGCPLLLLLVAFFVGSKTPQRLLALFGAIILALLVVGIVTKGQIAMWAILAVGLFCSVMWSNIFALAIEGLGALKSQGSSLLVMGIVGGAFLPLAQAKVADNVSIQFSFIIPAIAFAYIVFYGIYGYRAGRKPGEVAAPVAGGI